MKKQKVLFVCIHNSARSQMAEAWLNYFYGDRFEAKSAGLEPGSLNPLAVMVMEEVGIDLSRYQTKSVFNMIKSGGLFSWVITVCDESSTEHCPIFPGPAQRLHWSFPDPALLTGTFEEKKDQVRIIRNNIREKVRLWGASVSGPVPRTVRQ